MAEDVLSKGLQLPDQAFDEKELDQIQVENFMKLCLPKSPFVYRRDAKSMRCGLLPDYTQCSAARKLLKEAKEFLDRQNFERSYLSESSEFANRSAEIFESISELFQDPLPNFEPLYMHYHACLDQSAINDADRPLDIKLWFSNKEMNPDSLLGDYTNNRDETRLVVTLTDSKSQPERKAYSKEEQEKLYIQMLKRRQANEALEKECQANKNDFSFMNSSWADPKSLHRNLHNFGDLKYHK